MDQSTARIVSFVRTVETTSAGAEFWLSPDADWATRLAIQEVGDKATPERFITVRARIAWQRMTDRKPAFEKSLKKLNFRWLLGWLLILSALILGVLVDQIGDAKQVNLLALPFLGIIAWNVVMYAVVLFVLPILGLIGIQGWGRRWLGTALSGLHRNSTERLFDDNVPLRVRCMADWAAMCQSITTASVARIWHLSAAMLVIGLIAALYSRGLYTEYRVGWESTLLDASHVQSILATFFGLIPFDFGLVAPDIETVEQMRFSAGGGLSAARPWLHVMASLSLILVVLPRFLLAFIAYVRQRFLERQFPIDLKDDYFQKLIATYNKQPTEVFAIPYGKAISPSSTIVLSQIVDSAFGSRSVFKIRDTVQFGGEDDMQLVSSGTQNAAQLALFDLTSTPENENHGAFLKALSNSTGRSPIALVDSFEFKARFGKAGDRLQQRVRLWKDFLAAHNVSCVIGDFSEEGASGLRQALEAVIV